MSNTAYQLYFLIKSDMKKFSKMLVIVFVWIFCFAGVYTYATTSPTYDGVLIEYLQAEKTSIGDLFDTTYDTVYTAFAKTGLTIVKSIEYQGLVCLWAIKDGGLLSQLQKDKIAFKVAFNRDFVELEKRVLWLEEKKRIQEENNITMFDPGTTYETEKAALKQEIDAKAQTYTTLIANFSTTYTRETAQLISNFQSYLAANQQLLSGIKNKMTKIQAVVSGFAEIDTTITKINGKITGLDDLIKKIETSKSKWLTALDSTMQSLVTINTKRYKKLQNLDGALTQQKLYVLGQYQMDIDEYVSNSLQNRYNRSTYVALKDEVEKVTSLYYTSSKQLNCSNMLSTVDSSASLLVKIANMKIEVNSWLANIEKYGITTAVKDQIYSGFQSMYIQKFKQRYNEYVAYLKNYITVALKNVITSNATSTAQTSVATTQTTSSEKISTVVFTKPFKSGQYSQDIKALQNVLTTLWLYAWAIDGVYSVATKEAVYQFQLSKWLLKWYENKPDVRWYFWPATRKAINALSN